MTNAVRLPLPVDPDLRPGFDDTPNEQRSKAELDAWWDQPYLLTNADGSYSARTLNGGAWDRSTFLGTGATIEEATAIALENHARFVRFRSRPTASIREDGAFDIARMPQRPDATPTLLAAGLSLEEVKSWMADNADPEV